MRSTARPPLRAGQAAALASGRAASATPYSIASAPAETARHGALEFLVKVDGSNRFGAVVEGLEPGTPLRVDGPAGNFTLPDLSGGAPLLFVAGGTGIAPLRSMIREALEARRHRIARAGLLRAHPRGVRLPA